jgi:hypothetical protein
VGTANQIKAVQHVIKNSKPDAKDIANNLNESGLGYRDWKGEETKDGFVLKTKDPWGNAKSIIIRKKDVE